MVDQSYRDRAALVHADNTSGGLVGKVAGAFGLHSTDFQKKLRDERQTSVVQPRRQELKKLRESLAREEREVLRRYQDGRPESFKEYGISPGDYQRDREGTIEKLKQNFKERRRNKIREVERRYEKQWNALRRDVYSARKDAFKNNPNVS